MLEIEYDCDYYFVFYQKNSKLDPIKVQAPQNFGIPLLLLHRNETIWDDPAVSINDVYVLEFWLLMTMLAETYVLWQYSLFHCPLYAKISFYLICCYLVLSFRAHWRSG